jgi:phage tail-like protein
MSSPNTGAAAPNLSGAATAYGLAANNRANPLTASTVAAANRFVIAFSVSLTTGKVNGSLTFSELTNISSEVDPAEYYHSSSAGVVLSKQFGKTKPATVTLKRGVDDDASLWTWHQGVLDGDPSARSTSCSLVMYDTQQSPKAQYYLYNAWPSKLAVDGVKAGGSDVVYTTVTLTCDQIVYVPTGAQLTGSPTGSVS